MMSSGNKNYYDIGKIGKSLGNDVVKALPYFYAFTGCDTTSSLFTKGKNKCWDVWMKDTRHSELTSVFCQLGNRPSAITNQHLDVLEYFMIRLYNPGSREISSNLASERVFAIQRMLDNDLRKLPISRLGLVEHAKRSCYQAGYLWQESIENVYLPDPVLWGWTRHENRLVPRWQEGDTLPISGVILTCSCRTNGCKNCNCVKKGTVCLPFCFCRRSCSNI